MAFDQSGERRSNRIQRMFFKGARKSYGAAFNALQSGAKDLRTVLFRLIT